MGYDLLFSDHGYRVYRQEQRQLDALRMEISRLRAERERVARQILRLRNDPKALEELAHRELGYVYPDELIVVMPEKPVKRATGRRQ